jgi:hypothetical protein
LQSQRELIILSGTSKSRHLARHCIIPNMSAVNKNNNVSWTNLSKSLQNDYIEQNMGADDAAAFDVVFPTLFYSVVLLFGLPGNLMTCLIIYFKKKKSPTSNFLLNLAITDLITLTIGKQKTINMH